MKSGIPSLNSLIVFEKAASTLSFKAAADELCITPPAVSHQIRALEDELGVQLFNRLNRAIELTDAGADYYQKIAPALVQLRSATSQISSPSTQSTFRINCIPFIASTILIPSIHQFMDRHADLNVEIQSLPSGQGLKEEQVAVEIRLDNDGDPELHYESLMPIYVTPICSESYLKKHPETCEDLSHHRLIKLRSKTDIWSQRAKQYGYSVHGADELFVDNYQSVLAAVQSDMGVAMGYFSKVPVYPLSSNTVKLLSDEAYELGDLYLVYLKKHASTPAFVDFKNWLLRLCQLDAHV